MRIYFLLIFLVAACAIIGCKTAKNQTGQEEVNSELVEAQSDEEDFILNPEADAVEEEQESIFVIVETMPIAPGCEELAQAERNKCSFNFVDDFIRANVEWPQLEGVSGTVFVKYVINKQGSIVDIELAHSVQPDFDQAAMECLKTLPIFIPGKQQGRPVSVRFTVAIPVE
jgi:periplasmic protein TonB